jgi:hypothetical protein
LAVLMRTVCALQGVFSSPVSACCCQRDEDIAAEALCHMAEHYRLLLPWLCCAGPTDCITKHCIRMRESSVLGRPHVSVSGWRDTQHSYRWPRPNWAGSLTAGHATQETSGCHFIERILEALKVHAKGVNMPCDVVKQRFC